MRKIKNKILAVILSTALGLEGCFPKTKNEYIIVGTPEQIDYQINKSYDILVPLATTDKIKDREKLIEISRITSEIPIKSSVYFNFSTKFDNSEGSRQNPIEMEQSIQYLIYEQLKTYYEKAKAEFAIQLPNRYTPDEIDQLFRSALEINLISTEGTLIGYACPMGGSHEKNVRLSQLRAEQTATLLAKAVQDFFFKTFSYDLDARELLSNFKISGNGSIYEDSRVQEVVNQLNKLGFKIDYGNIIKKDKREILNFDLAMKTLQAKNPSFFEYLKGLMNPLRRVDFNIKIIIDAVAYGERIVVKEREVTPGLIPEKPKLAQVREYARQRLREDVRYTMKPILPLLLTRRKNRPRYEAGKGPVRNIKKFSKGRGLAKAPY